MARSLGHVGSATGSGLLQSHMGSMSAGGAGVLPGRIHGYRDRRRLMLKTWLQKPQGSPTALTEDLLAVLRRFEAVLQSP